MNNILHDLKPILELSKHLCRTDKINWNSFRFIGEEEEDVVGDETIPLQDMNKNGFNNGEAEDAVSNTTDKTNLTVNQNGHAADTVVSIVSSTPETNNRLVLPIYKCNHLWW